MEGSRTILIADDAPMFRELESLFLARLGRVVAVGDGGEALIAIRRERPDVVVTDLCMRGMDGDQLCRLIRSDPDLRRTPVIIVTGGDDPESHARAVRAGADDVLEKPLDRVTLIQAVNRFLRLAVRGLVRIPFETDVRLGVGEDQSWGWSRNLSRGGMFVEAETTVEPDTEVCLEFALPETQLELSPTAKVVWRRQRTPSAGPGMGLRFLKLDGESARWIDDYVYERTTQETDDAGPNVPVR